MGSIAELDAKSDYWLNQQGRLTEPMVKWPGGTHYERPRPTPRRPNVLVPLDSVADISNMPTSKGVVVRQEPVVAAAG